ncbi:hypothetical protein SAMN05216562_1639 [Microbulbifer marinus]|uniref:Uncharacterized protein n=1 Tax=Microbulbifer marinus TaxID=658218 RepID=A0A1H3YA87_9GAMM|nr:hypothetical protein SAMN05216562_1639 [Microbulbifer marinus]
MMFIRGGTPVANHSGAQGHPVIGAPGNLA